jgi:glycosyltransferase involved in cell wall biosynthesis
MKILIIGYMHKKYDKRVFRTLEALSKNNEVVYQYLTTDNENKHKEKNITYFPIKHIEDINMNSFKKMSYREKTLDKKILDIVKKEDYDLLYMHHFLASRPIAPFKIAKRKNKKVVFDLHELHPENFMESFTGVKKKIKESIMWKVLKKQIDCSDKLIFVSKEMKEYVKEKLKINIESKVVTNYASTEIKSQKKTKTISFVGKTARGLENEIKVLKEMIKKGYEFKIIGMDAANFENIEHTYTSFLPYEEMIEELSKTSFSLISYTLNEDEIPLNFVFSMPNKFFDSIAAETPVIVNENFKSMANLVKKYGIGVLINPKNIEESVEKIEKAYENYDEMIENIRKYKHEFVWTEEIEKDFVDFVVD